MAFDQAAGGLEKGPMFVFFFEMINTEENPFLFVTTPAIEYTIQWI